MPLRRSTRLRAFDYLGSNRYFVTICTNRRTAVFRTAEAVSPVLSQLVRTAARFGFEIIAYCFMPDHLHVLVAGVTDSADFRAFMHDFKQRTAFRWKRNHGTTLWERSYFEHVLRHEEDTVSVARYIVGNPVRARLVENPGDCPYSGSVVLGTGDLLDSIRQM